MGRTENAVQFNSYNGVALPTPSSFWNDEVDSSSLSGGYVVEFESIVQNDNFVDRIDLGNAFSIGVTGANAGYTGEAGEPAQSGQITSAWWQWTAPANAPVTMNTFGSNFDTFLTLATGSDVTALAVLAQNDDADGALQSQILFNGVMGTDYRIAVDGFLGETGDIALNINTVPETSTLASGLICSLAALAYLRRRT